MKQNKIRILSFLGLTILSLFIFFSCQKDDSVSVDEPKRLVKSRMVSLSEIPNTNTIDLKIQELGLKKRNNVLGRTTDVDTSYVNTDDILEMSYSETHTYTFKLISPNPEYYIENVILHYNVTTQEYDSYLVQYDVSAQEYIDIHNGGEIPETAELLISEINGSGFVNLISSRSSCYRVCQTIDVPCQDPGGAEHQPGDTTCIYHGGSLGAYSYQSCGSVCFDSPQDPIIDAGPSGGGGGGTNDVDVVTNPNTNEPCENNGTVGITNGDDGCNLVPDPECLKISDLMYNLNVDIQQILQSLAPFANANFEAAFTVDNTAITGDGSNAIGASEGTQGTSSATINNNPANPYITIAHTHDAYGLDGNGTFSVFSFEDLKILAKTLYNNKIDGTFVAFLITAKGTRYAMTIKDTSKFLDLFYMHSNTLPTTANDISKWTISKENLEPLYKDYYDTDNENRKIKEIDTNNENVLKHFLKFLEDGDAGLSLFEANESFDSFQPVTLDRMGNVKRNLNPCNTQN